MSIKLVTLVLLWASIQSLEFVCARRANDLKVCLPNLGCLQGSYQRGHLTESYEAFMGVPFAKPPLGELRFKNPEPVEPWSDVLDVKKPKPFCLQKNYVIASRPVTGEEDCLYLNLYRPMRRSTNPLPVMFYLHGGGFFSGAAHPALWGPAYFMDTEQVILVVTAYRLGPFGFLSTGDQNIPGNMGLKDQTLALKWVKENIVHFGGDPNAVTLFGHSAGASAVHFHIISPASRGLFQRALMMSGSSLSPFVNILEQPLMQAIKIAEVSGIKNAAAMSTSHLTAALCALDGQTLLDAGDSLKFWYLYPLTNFRPVIEDAAWPDAFLVESQDITVQNESIYNKPWMIGMVPVMGEGSITTLGILTNETLRQQMNHNFKNIIEQLMEFPRRASTTAKNIAVQWIMEEYFHGMRELNETTAVGLREFYGDMQFAYPYYRTIKSYLDYRNEAMENPLYLFKFSYRGPNSFSQFLTSGSNDDYGAVHMDDTLYLFKEHGLSPKPYLRGSSQAKLVREYVRMYVDFAKTGYSHNFDKLNACTKESFYQADIAGICEYIEFLNNGDGYKIIQTNAFNIKRMRLWDKIMKLYK